ncbi:MAG: biotin/lipoyl-binding protein [Isosphaeraceae bacterium]|nr:biotin/lipoyl-binding protein [Isosphaeraceae bacterium]
MTNVGPRVEGLVTEVRVDQTDRVAPGTLLVRLHREPFEVALARSQAALEEASSTVGVTSLVGHDQGFALLANMVQAQARVMSYLDVFWVLWILTLVAFPLVFLMKKSVAHRGATMH